MSNQKESLKKIEWLDKEQRNKRIIVWSIRQIITLGLVFYFWEISWVKWTLILLIPLAFFSLYSIMGKNKRLNDRILKKVTEKDENENL